MIPPYEEILIIHYSWKLAINLFKAKRQGEGGTLAFGTPFISQ